MDFFFPFSYCCIDVLGEANFLGGVASLKGVKGFNTEAAKKRFFEIYLNKVNVLLITTYQCKELRLDLDITQII